MGITKGDKENSYIVHFSDSAMVSRAVARGYVTVNGKEVELTEDTKQQLLKTDKEASTARKRHIRIMLCSMRWRLQSNRVKRGEKR